MTVSVSVLLSMCYKGYVCTAESHCCDCFPLVTFVCLYQLSISCMVNVCEGSDDL